MFVCQGKLAIGKQVFPLVKYGSCMKSCSSPDTHSSLEHFWTLFLPSTVGKTSPLLVFLGVGGRQGGERKVREHPQIMQTIAETEQERENHILVRQIVVSIFWANKTLETTPSSRNLFTVNPEAAAYSVGQYGSKRHHEPVEKTFITSIWKVSR